MCGRPVAWASGWRVEEGEESFPRGAACGFVGTRQMAEKIQHLGEREKIAHHAGQPRIRGVEVGREEGVPGGVFTAQELIPDTRDLVGRR